MKFAANAKTARIISLAAILLLLLQVQTVFACEMPEHFVSATAVTDGSHVGCACCATDLSMSIEADCPDQQALLPQTKFAAELPQLSVAPRAEWPPILAPPKSHRFHKLLSTPNSPGNRTWLATLRLRL